MQRLVTFEHLVELGYVNNRVTLGRRIRRGEFPAPIRIGARNVAWLKAEIDAWEEARCAERARGDARSAAALPASMGVGASAPARGASASASVKAVK